MFPDKAVSKVRIPDGKNVDEFVSRQFGGRQVTENQHLMTDSVNQHLGSMEYHATSNLPAGTKIQGFDIEWEP
jgi:hypothetical protein